MMMTTGGENPRPFSWQWPSSFSSQLTVILFLIINRFAAANLVAYSPPDNYLIDCGSRQQTKLEDGRTFKSDHESSSYLLTEEDIVISVDSIPLLSSNVIAAANVFPLYHSARSFRDESRYTFAISQQGSHWVRLYFYPLPHPAINLANAVFTVQTDKFVLLQHFSVVTRDSVVFKEYLINITAERFSIIFKPQKNSLAFINAIEVVSVPDSIIPDSVSTVDLDTFTGLVNFAFEVSYRLNVGGPTLTPKNDTLSRTWLSDAPCCDK